MKKIVRTIIESLDKNPLRALKAYEERVKLEAPLQEILEHRYGDAMVFIEAGRDIGKRLNDLPFLNVSGRREDRRRMLSAAVDQLVDLGNSADANPSAQLHEVLNQIGSVFPKLILDGPLHQQLACKLAMRLGTQRDLEMPRSVCQYIATPLIKALIVVLRLGAPNTRDSAVEGLGALLKLVGGDPTIRFPSTPEIPVLREKDEDPGQHAIRATISKKYFERLERRRLMVLTIAGDTASRAEYSRMLKEPIAEQLDRLLQPNEAQWEKVKDVLYEHPDLLRILPAIAHQDLELRAPPIDLLCEAARVLTLREGAPHSALIAFARFQESVFRTIDAKLQRNPKKWSELDGDVAAAVRCIPQAIAGSPAVCNSQIRATVAILRTAIRLLKVSGRESETKKAITPFFNDLNSREPWSNPGIAEGCFRGLQELIAEPVNDDLTRPALDALFKELHWSCGTDDLIDTHRRLIANSCFRRLLVLLTDSGHERRLHIESNEKARSESLKAEHQIRALLSDPTPETVRRIRHHESHEHEPSSAMKLNVAQMIVAGVAFESELLRREATLFQGWSETSTAKQALLVRILAAQLHAITRDAPELQRHALLRRVFTDFSTVATSDDETTRIVWALLSSLPAGAAEAADADIQRFVENRPPADSAHLPGHVLAMISPVASGRIAGAIAREIDLNLQHEDAYGRHPDIARSLHQVMLRGPHESIFDHLLPRVAETDRPIVLLFRKHVANVSSFDLPGILEHIRTLKTDLCRQTSPTLRTLKTVLELYEELTLHEPSVWQSIADGKVLGLISKFDELAAQESRRKALYDDFKGRLTDLQDNVKHYVALPVGKFDPRAEVLKKARDLVDGIEKSLQTHEGLQPPERTLLIRLVEHFRDLFDGTIRSYCDEPRLRSDADEKEYFWLLFCDRRNDKDRILAFRDLLARDKKKKNQPATKLEEEIGRLEDWMKTVPPEFSMQRAKFEEFFVEWMSSDLDVQTLKGVLSKRWPNWFVFIYGIMTDFWWMSLLIFVPCAFAAAMNLFGKHHWEGLGFFVLTFGMIGGAMLTFTQFIHTLARSLRLKAADDDLPGYWFPCLLPRLARLTAVPMAFIVEFDHSYDFPMNGSTPMLLLLMIISFVTTRFVVTREIVDRKEQPGVFTVTPDERSRVRQIVGVALAHSFGIAVLLSAIFASGHEYKKPTPDPHVVHIATGVTAGPWKVLEAVLGRFDEVSGDINSRPRFLGFIPRVVSLDLGEIAAKNNYPLPLIVAQHATLKFYPTIILTWTALGLFFGIFLEGFMKGQRLRGAWPGEESATS